MTLFHPLITLAYTPLYDPLTAVYPGLSDHWLWLVIPLVLAISVIYKGTRMKKLRELPLRSAILAAQILVVMAVAAVGLDLFYAILSKF